MLISGGLTRGKGPLEVDPFTFVPRVTVPTLLINGREDFLNLPETSLIPLYNALGTPARDKLRLTADGPHGFNVAQVSAEIRQWLDTYLGAP